MRFSEMMHPIILIPLKGEQGKVKQPPGQRSLRLSPFTLHPSPFTLSPFALSPLRSSPSQPSTFALQPSPFNPLISSVTHSSIHPAPCFRVSYHRDYQYPVLLIIVSSQIFRQTGPMLSVGQKSGYQQAKQNKE